MSVCSEFPVQQAAKGEQITPGEVAMFTTFRCFIGDCNTQQPGLKSAKVAMWVQGFQVSGLRVMVAGFCVIICSGLGVQLNGLRVPIGGI